MTFSDWATLLLAAIGTILGVINFIKSYMDERVRLKVIPSLAWSYGGGILRQSSTVKEERFQQLGPPALAVEIVNFSLFPVTVDDVGITDPALNGRRLTITPGIGDSLPARLEPRTAITVYTDELVNIPVSHRTTAYARTACDHTSHGKSEALTQWATYTLGRKTNRQ